MTMKGVPHRRCPPDSIAAMAPMGWHSNQKTPFFWKRSHSTPTIPMRVQATTTTVRTTTTTWKKKECSCNGTLVTRPRRTSRTNFYQTSTNTRRLLPFPIILLVSDTAAPGTRGISEVVSKTFTTNRRDSCIIIINCLCTIRRRKDIHRNIIR